MSASGANDPVRVSANQVRARSLAKVAISGDGVDRVEFDLSAAGSTPTLDNSPAWTARTTGSTSRS